MNMKSPNHEIEISDLACLAKTPLVSVAMVTYNHEVYIGEAIEGVVRQQALFPIELVIGEDMSTDRTREIVMGYQRRYPHMIRIISSAANVGSALNFKRVVNATRGAFLAICDGDDVWMSPQKLAKQVALFNDREMVQVVYADHAFLVPNGKGWAYRGGGGRFSDYKKKYPMNGHLFKVDPLLWHVPTCTVVYRGETCKRFVNMELFDDHTLLLDWPLYVFASAFGEARYLDEVVSAYRLTPNSLTRSSPQKSLKLFEDWLAWCVILRGWSLSIGKRDIADGIDQFMNALRREAASRAFAALNKRKFYRYRSSGAKDKLKSLALLIPLGANIIASYFRLKNRYLLRKALRR